MKNKTAKSKKDVIDFITTRSFDPCLKDYYEEYMEAFNQKDIRVLPSQYLYYFNFYERNLIHANDNVYKILGYSCQEVNYSLIYDVIHPADRLLVFAATMKSIQHAAPHLKPEPFEDTFIIDFRVKHKKGHYKRIMRQTGCAVVDKLYNMIMSYAFHTDISKIKTTSSVGMHYCGYKNIDFPDSELLELRSLFSKREKDILYHLCNGKTSAQISEELFISKHTVDTHRRNMLKKAMLKNTPELIIYGLENGLV